MELSMITLFSTLVATPVAVKSRRWIFWIRMAQFLFSKYPVPISYPRYRMVPPGGTTSTIA